MGDLEAFGAEFDGEAVLFVLVTLGVPLGLAIHGYNPARGMMSREGGGG